MSARRQPATSQPHKGSRCGRTGKRLFKTHDGAMQRAGELIMSSDWKSGMARAYRCDFCGGYHITHKEQH